MGVPPSGVVTFLMTDVEGSTELWERDEKGMDNALARHDAVMRSTIDGHGFWANLDFALRRVVFPLAQLGRIRPAAMLLGGLTALRDVTPDTQQVVPRATATLSASLGDEFPALFDEGASCTKYQLVRLALEEIDAALAPQGEW